MGKIKDAKKSPGGEGKLLGHFVGNEKKKMVDLPTTKLGVESTQQASWGLINLVVN